MEKKKEFKVLLIYVAQFMQLGLPLGHGSLTAALKNKGIDVKIFDTVFYQEPGAMDINLQRSDELHQTIPIDYSSKGIAHKTTDEIEDFKRIVKEYNPDLIGLSSTESAFSRGVRLIRAALEVKKVPVIAGGVFCTLASDIAIKEDSIDMICIGDGEDALSELCAALRDGKDYTGIDSLWIKKDGKLIKNKIRSLKPLEDVLSPDFSAFDPKLFYRPMRGKLYRGIPVETSRGCPYNCTYCADPGLEKTYARAGHSGYFRKKPMPQLLNELNRAVKKYNAEFFHFTSETFLLMSEKEFDEFITGYGKIKLPFWIQTRVETITEDRIRRLKEVGLLWLSLGIEHGNEEYRKKYLKRMMSNEKIKEAVRILNKCDQGASLNNIIGFPFETRELIYDTIRFNHELFKINNRTRFQASIFTPFRGCELYDVCVKNNLIEELPYTSHTNITKGSLLKSDYLTKDELDGFFRTFNLYVYLPDSYHERVRIAENLTSEGNKEFTLLNREVEQYLKGQ